MVINRADGARYSGKKWLDVIVHHWVEVCLPFHLPALLPPPSISTSKSTCLFNLIFLLSAPKQEGVQTQMRVSGVSAGSYWGCHLIIDCTQMYGITVVGVIAIIVIGLAVGNSSLFTAGALFMFIVFMILFLPMYSLFAYCVSFIFTQYQSAQSGSQLFFTWVSIRDLVKLSPGQPADQYCPAQGLLPTLLIHLV